MRRPLILGVVALACSLPLVAGFELAQGNRGTSRTAMPLLVDQVREALAGSYYRSLPQSVLRLNSVEEIISALRDPYTAYLGASEYKLLQHETASSYSGIGVGVLQSSGGLIVASLHPGGPASAAGIRAGDTIVAVNGQPVAHVSIAEALARFTGPVGSRVQIDALRGGETFRVTVRRAVVRAPTVEAKLVSFGGRKWGSSA